MFLSGTKIFKSGPEKGTAKALLLAPERVEVGGGKRQGTELLSGRKKCHPFSACFLQSTHRADNHLSALLKGLRDPKGSGDLTPENCYTTSKLECIFPVHVLEILTSMCP